jgi:hypothetical protein
MYRVPLEESIEGFFSYSYWIVYSMKLLRV